MSDWLACWWLPWAEGSETRCPAPPLFSESIKIHGVTWPALWKARKLELVSH